MISFFNGLNVYLQTLLASSFTFFVTTLGASTIFLFKKINSKIMNIMLSLSSGIMLSAAIFSLLLPAIEQAEILNLNVILVISLSIILGTILLILGDKLASKFNKHQNTSNIFLLIVSIVLHNIPEGMAIGVAFGSIIYGLDNTTIEAALSLSLAIGIQNFPEGAAISFPLRNIGLSRKESFIIGSLSGIVEPIFALIGTILVLKIKLILPYLLAFAAGAMIFVVVEELIPEAMDSKSKNLMAFIILIGFIIMMILELGM